MSDDDKVPQEPHDDGAQDTQTSKASEGNPASRDAHDSTVLREKLLRLQADFDNFRKRLEREQEEFVKCSNRELLSDLLPVLDNFERALENTDDPGVRMIYDQAMEVLGKHGLEEINAEGQEFDPRLHEALVAQPSSDAQENTVLEVFQKGYMVQERVLRPSKVMVAKATDDVQKGEKERGDDVDE